MQKIENDFSTKLIYLYYFANILFFAVLEIYFISEIIKNLICS